MTAAWGRRIAAEVAGRRGARVVALDDDAAALVRRLAQQTWNAAHFAALAVPPADGGDLWLHTTDGDRRRLTDELVEADVVVMVSTAAGDGRAAAVIGDACRQRGITTAAVVVGDQDRITATVGELRPHARVLLTGPDPGDVGELLTALRA